MDWKDYLERAQQRGTTLRLNGLGDFTSIKDVCQMFGQSFGWDGVPLLVTIHGGEVYELQVYALYALLTTATHRREFAIAVGEPGKNPLSADTLLVMLTVYVHYDDDEEVSMGEWRADVGRRFIHL